MYTKKRPAQLPRPAAKHAAVTARLVLDLTGDDDDDDDISIPIVLPTSQESHRVFMSKLFDEFPDDDDYSNFDSASVPDDQVPAVLRPAEKRRNTDWDERGYNPLVPVVEQGAAIDAWMATACSPAELENPLRVLALRGANVAATMNWIEFEARQGAQLRSLIARRQESRLDDAAHARYASLLEWFRARKFARKHHFIERHLSDLSDGIVSSEQ